MYAYESELYHHGIKGMKWGVRRYQNDDGTLTGAGKKRYSDDNGYNNKMELLRDYSFIPTVMMPRHKKIEIIPLLWKHIISKKR